MSAPVRRPFSISWEINLGASTPEEAAKEALRLMRDNAMPATLVVYDEEGNATAHTFDAGGAQ